jgi:hypothetical protein
MLKHDAKPIKISHHGQGLTEVTNGKGTTINGSINKQGSSRL